MAKYLFVFIIGHDGGRPSNDHCLPQTYAHIVKWAYGLAITYESLRMYPPVMGFLCDTAVPWLITYQVISFPKYAVNDTVITTSSTDGKNTPISIPVPAGTDMMVNVTALHYNGGSIHFLWLRAFPKLTPSMLTDGLFSQILGRARGVSTREISGRLQS
jgi:hypothetical protein